MTQGLFEGFAMPVQNAGFIGDHTYVATPIRRYGCHGRNVGGALICSGSGNIDEGECLSDPGGAYGRASDAGIAYGVTGVCHQIANRVLHSTGLKVSRARGYRFFFILYGAYGRDPQTGSNHCPSSNPWPALATCQALHQH